MSVSGTRLAAGCLLMSLAGGMPVTVLAAESTAARLDRLERQLDSRGLLDMLNRLDQLQRDMQELRGEMELQAHRQEDMSRRQRELYLDIDRRLQQLEAGQVATPATSTSPLTITPATSTDVTAPPPAAVTPAAGTVTASPVTSSASEQAEYEQALSILREGRYTDASAAFRRLLASYPASEYADNSTYWLGETYYVTRDFSQALATFSRLVSEYPASPKVPDARLKMGYIHYENGEWAQARQELSAVVSDYPGTTAARLANDRLQRMAQEGH